MTVTTRARINRWAKLVIVVWGALVILGGIAYEFADAKFVTEAEARAMLDARDGPIMRELDSMHADIREIRDHVMPREAQQKP